MLVVRKRAGKTEDRLEIRLVEVLSDVSHEMGEAAGAGEGRRRARPPGGARRAAGGARRGAAARPARVADRHRPGRPDVPRRRRRLGRGRDQAHRRRSTRSSSSRRYLERIRARPGAGRVPRRARRAALPAAGGDARRVARDPLRRGRSRRAARRARARADALRVALGRGQGHAAARLLVRARQVFELTQGSTRSRRPPSCLRTDANGPRAARTATRASRRGTPRRARTGNG